MSLITGLDPLPLVLVPVASTSASASASASAGVSASVSASGTSSTSSTIARACDRSRPSQEAGLPERSYAILIATFAVFTAI